MKKLLTLLAFCFMIACQTEEIVLVKPNSLLKDVPASLMTDWNDLYLKMNDHLIGYRPPISARAMGYLGLNAYAAIAPTIDDNQSIAKLFPDLKLPSYEPGKTYHWGVALNSAMSLCYPNIILRIPFKDSQTRDSLYKSYNDKFKNECDSETFQRSQKWGFDVAVAVYRFAVGDGQLQAANNNKPTDFIPKVGPGLWRSTLPDTLRALTPTWGKVRVFAIKEEDRAMKVPLAYSTDKKSEFYKQAKEVYDAVKGASKEDIWIAEYWSDDASTYTIDAGARWLSIANQAMKLKKTNLEQSVIITAKIGMVLHDAAVACWDNKYKYNVLRPYSYITETIDPAWKTLLRDPTKKAGQQIGVTPQHPSYPSGHSVFGQAAAEVLITELGDKINLTDRTNEGDTFYDYRPRTFKTFTAMAKENAYSRIKLGVHFRMDCDEGLALGKKVGTRINSLPWRKPAL